MDARFEVYMFFNLLIVVPSISLNQSLNQNCRCFGPGSCPSKRVTWCRELIDEESEQFLMHGFIDPDPERPWLAQRMALRIPYSA